MKNINYQQNVDGVAFNLVSLHEEGHEAEIDQEEQRVPRGDPPIDSRLFWRKVIENALNDQS